MRFTDAIHQLCLTGSPLSLHQLHFNGLVAMILQHVAHLGYLFSNLNLMVKRIGPVLEHSLARYLLNCY